MYIKKQEKFTLWPKEYFIDYFECNKCNNFFQNTPLSGKDRDLYYSKAYRSSRIFGRPHHYHKESKYHLWADYLIKTTGIKKGQKILDVGCAEGHQVLRFKELGYDSYGIEPSEPMIKYAKKELNLKNVKCGSYSLNSYPKEYFNCITSYHVIEHVVDHIDFIKTTSKHLKLNGYLVLSTPCGESAQDYYKKNEISENMLKNVLGGGHALLFSSQYLVSQLNKMGFKIIKQQIIDNLNFLLKEKKIAPSGEKWLGMNIFAKKISQ